MRRATVILGAAAAAAAIAATSYVLLLTLPTPTQGERIGVDVLRYIGTTRGRGSVISLAGRTIRARCKPIGYRRVRITLDDGSSLLLRGTRIRGWRAPLVSGVRVHEPAIVRVAKAELAGSHHLYSAELRARLQNGDDVLAGTLVWRGMPAYRVRLSSAQPVVELVVAKESSRLLAARFRARTLEATSVLLQSHRRGARRTC